MKKLLIISHIQFGYLTEVLFYCRELQTDYQITYIGFDFGMKKISPPEGVKVLYIKRSSNKLYNYINFIKFSVNAISKQNYNLCLIFYFTTCSFIRLLSPKSNLIVDIRTSFIFKSVLRRYFFNSLLWVECLFFRNISIISEGLSKYLHLIRKTHVVPLGGEITFFNKKEFSAMKILYVGTFYERNIEDTISGVARFIDEFPEIDVQYTIIGYGPDDKIKLINDEIKKNDKIAKGKIQFLGEIRYPELQNFLDNHNVGICYVPIESYYDFQPPTKTFEYLLGGMVVIATNTYENRKVINDNNGILINHSTDEIYMALKKVFISRKLYNSENIRNNSIQYTWNYIINKNLRPYLSLLSMNKP